MLGGLLSVFGSEYECWLCQWNCTGFWITQGLFPVGPASTNRHKRSIRFQYCSTFATLPYWWWCIYELDCDWQWDWIYHFTPMMKPRSTLWRHLTLLWHSCKMYCHTVWKQHAMIKNKYLCQLNDCIILLHDITSPHTAHVMGGPKIPCIQLGV